MVRYLFDTSPLITLASAFVDETTTALAYLAQRIHIAVVQTVADEATANLIYPDARQIKRLIEEELIDVVELPETAQDTLIDAYTKLGPGERDTIRLATDMNASIVLDDYLAFVIATRFNIDPSLLLDLLIHLTENNMLDIDLASAIIEQTKSRYSPPFVSHTLHKLSQIGTENDDTHSTE